MPKKLLIVMCLTLFALPLAAQKSPTSMAEAYDALADSILALRAAEDGFVRVVLDDHYRGAKRSMARGEFERAAAEMALFATEGDNAIAGIRKKLVEGGHHHNADDGEDGEYETGFVVVTRKAKKKILAVSAAMRQAGTDEERQAAWNDFDAIVEKLLAKM
ncbi:MAG: hypothetical protein GY769_22285 [bacterium]|nr:hypothetical protein [bacterium]